MASVVLFHHLQGLTPGVLAFAEQLRAGGHAVATPDLFGGALPASLEEGLALTREIGEAELDARAEAAASAGSVFAGISYGVKPAQRLAQTFAGARAALLYEACFPITGEWAFGPWPHGVPVQVHGMEQDEFFGREGDLEAAQELASTVPGASLFVYPGDRHLFTDSSLPSYDAAAAELVVQRSLAFLDRLN
ncbi:dienelactone hydrolase family protein [Paractinoplanes durhamensis]|uniref:Dienelactone hydrolase n=1 Tax=Paractinoplanes durhamensis TaxID=113563 RepID=A0ABQ3YVR9_9ACTN|nr:dienelactone hydrolase family protein [Actinoplanes durhamensis]GIE01695.1 dienelactone hydrolase [Actinoplanes durhamensis]